SNWSALRGVESVAVLRAAAAVWAVALVFLLIGLGTRFWAVVVWVLSTSFANLNADIDNGGDVIRGITLFYLMLCPCGAAWSVDAWLKKRPAPVLVPPWPLRLLFLQLVLIYFCNGMHKLAGADWRAGSSLFYVLCAPTPARFPYRHLPLPYSAARERPC